MKKIILCFLGLYTASVCLYPQTTCTPSYSTDANIYTCNALSIITRSASCEWSVSEKATLRQSVLNEYSSKGITAADILDEATTQYNCHAYAWHLREGNTNKFWIYQTENQNVNLGKYWTGTNSCFVEVDESNAEKIFYYAGDHSAVKSSVAGKYESKWGASVLVRHDPTAVPSIYQGNYRKYYIRRPTISGPSSLCSGSSGTFTVSNPPAGFTWSCSSNLSPDVASSTTKTFTGNASSGSFGWVSISIGQTEFARQAVWVGAPEITYISSYYNLGGQSQFHALYQPANPNTTLIWGIYPQGYSYNISNGGNPYLVSFQQPGNYTIMCRAQNEYDYGDIYSIDITLGGAVIYASAYPNPASDRINVRFDPEAIAHETARRQQLQQLSQKQSMSGSSRFSDAPASAPAFEIHLYDSKGILQRQAHSTGEVDALLSVSNLPNGVYLLHVYNSWTPLQPEVHTVIIKH